MNNYSHDNYDPQGADTPDNNEDVFYWVTEDGDLEALNEEVFMERVRILLEAQRDWNEELDGGTTF